MFPASATSPLAHGLLVLVSLDGCLAVNEGKAALERTRSTRKAPEEGYFDPRWLNRQSPNREGADTGEICECYQVGVIIDKRGARTGVTSAAIMGSSTLWPWKAELGALKIGIKFHSSHHALNPAFTREKFPSLQCTPFPLLRQKQSRAAMIHKYCCADLGTGTLEYINRLVSLSVRQQGEADRKKSNSSR